MAQFATQSRLKLLFHADGGSYKLVVNASVSLKLRPFCLLNGKIRIFGSEMVGYPASWRKKYCRLCAITDGYPTTTEDDLYGDRTGDFDLDFVEDELACFRGLVLDIAYRPINVVCWKRAICLEFMEKADVLEYYDQTVNSPNGSFNIPAVLRVPHLLQMVKRRRVNVNLSRKNILYRDKYTCQYCSSQENLTVDHVIPVMQGGKWAWENLVTACVQCNGMKGARTPDEANMTLLKQPKAPNDYDILAIPLTCAAIRMLRRRNGTPDEWRQYLSSES